MYIPDSIGHPLCSLCIDLLLLDDGLQDWSKCYWCWKWQYQIQFCWEIHQPLCNSCFLDFHDGKEAPWRPNARTRLELLLRRLLKHVIPLPDECVRRITEFARPGWLP